MPQGHNKQQALHKTLSSQPKASNLLSYTTTSINSIRLRQTTNTPKKVYRTTPIVKYVVLTKHRGKTPLRVIGSFNKGCYISSGNTSDKSILIV